MTIDWTPEMLDNLGKISDIEFSLKHHISFSTAKRKRLDLKIPSNNSYNWDNVPLGKMSDLTLARKLGKHRSTIRRQRIKRNIPPYKP